MDCDNGHIGLMNDLLKEGSDPRNLVPIRMADATRKQQEERRVSLKDHRSKLGIVLTKNQAKARRRKLHGK